MNSSDFYFRFNQSISLKRLEILDRSLSKHDLCHIANIPSHIPVKLLLDNQCSCSVYYLYRHLHRKLLPSILRDLTPLCYSNMSLDDIEHAENECSFKNQILNCQQMEGEIQINIPQGMCYDNNLVLNNKQEKKSSILLIIFLLIIFACFIFSIICLYMVLSKNRRLSSWNFLQKYFNHYRHRKFNILSADSYQQLTHIDRKESNRIRKMIVKYNSTTEQTEPYLDTDRSDFIVSNTDRHQNEDITVKLNTYSMSDIEENTL